MKHLLALLLLIPPALAVEPSSRHHPVGVPVPPSMRLPAAFETDSRGRLVCSTCHGVERLDELPVDEVDPEAPNFLRGGPYPRLERFCFRCHDEENYQRNNIHLQLNDQGELRKSTCTYCHREVPDRRKPPRSE